MAFRLVPYDNEERNFFPVCIPFDQIDFDYNEDDIHSIFSVPSVWYKNYNSQTGDVPKVFVYKFQSSSGMYQGLGPMQTLVNSYNDMQKIREYNEIVLSEHKYTLQYVEQEQVTRVSNETMAALEQTYYEMDDRKGESGYEERLESTPYGHAAPADVTKRTRNIISAQVIEFENDVSNELSGSIRKNVVVLPPGSRVSASTARQLSFHSQGESDVFFSKHVLRVFGVPDHWRHSGGDPGMSQPGSTKARPEKKKRLNHATAANPTKKKATAETPPLAYSTPICVQSFYSEIQSLLSELSSALCSPHLCQQTAPQASARGRKSRKLKSKHQRKHGQPDSIAFQELCMPQSVVWEIRCDEKKLNQFHGADVVGL